MPPVGGIPISSALIKSSSVVFASLSPSARSSSCAWIVSEFTRKFLDLDYISLKLGRTLGIGFDVNHL